MEWREMETVLKKHPEIIEGAKQSKSWSRLTNLLADYFPTEQKNIRLLKLALDINILHELEAKPIDVPLVRRLSKRLTDDFYIQEDMAVWAVDMWICAYGGGVLGKAGPCMEGSKRDEPPVLEQAAQFATVDSMAEQQRRLKEEQRQSEEKRRQEEYDAAVECMNKAKSEHEFRIVADAFSALSGIKDSDVQKEICLKRAEKCAREETYNSALAKISQGKKITLFNWRKYR